MIGKGQIFTDHQNQIYYSTKKKKHNALFRWINHQKRAFFLAKETAKQCPYSPGVFQGIRMDAGKLKGVSVQLPCNSWDCPVCAEKKMKRLRARVFNGALYAQMQKNGYRDRYNQKFLTLTLPGHEYRSIKTPEQALDDIKNNWDRLRSAVTKIYGKFHYFLIMEPQGDGFPHLHALIVGKNIAHKNILDFISRLWRENYGMGFVRLNVLTKNLKHGVQYATKYLLKRDNVKAERRNIRRFARIFSNSRGAIQAMPAKKKYDVFSKVYFGAATETGFTEIEIDAEQIPMIVRAGCLPEIRKRVCDDELQAITKLKRSVRYIK